MLGDFASVGLRRPDPTAAHGHTIMLRHSWCLLPQSIVHGTQRFMGVLVGAEGVCAHQRLAGKAVAPVRLAKDFVKREFE